MNSYEVVIIGTGVMLVMGIFVIVLVIFQQKQVIQHKLLIGEKDLQLQKERLVAILQGQELERKRIAEDLHDEVGAQLSVLKLNLNQLQPLLKSGNGEQEQLKETKEFTDTIIQHLRFISQSLHPQALENLGLSRALDSFCNMMNRNKQVQIHFTEDSNHHDVEPEKALNIYRVVQELINNILKHAQATQVQITYRTTPSLLSIYVVDNGNGQLLHSLENARHKTGSLGLKNIESRLNIIGGTISYKPGVPAGTIAEIKVENYQRAE
ncbi:sensor histidine kinase [Chitinophaga sancti]|uniref:histidine kinase n=1 Tax=Chitinophaga sancti TaxID=1004 RepID=A0A1K1MI40_9BACT|nr:histidine kinase [Chitinophaga sancti]WQD62712.1 histidine kinase [Chitinophaga sancti]WQG91664.1 histidine kinase [Chitinophaga sancti]SFW22844.1 Histidine kinase-, DNA gyrase B-, and HSP90-like ATPase [Chitinophaga sancti]